MELKIRLKSPMLSIRNGMITETHSIFPPGETNETVEYGIKSQANNIACTVSPFSILGWLRNGITEYLISQGISPCHSYDLTNVSKTSKKGAEYVAIAEQELKYGYHKKEMGTGEHKGKPECEAVIGTQCIVSKMFGGFRNHHRVFSLMPVKVSPIQANYEKRIKNITGKGNYRNIAISPRSHVNGTPFSNHSVDIIANLDAILYLRMYEDNPLYIAVIMRGIEYLSKNEDKFNHQIGGNRTFGCGFIDSTFLPPDLTRDETTVYHNYLIKNEDNVNDKIKLKKDIQDKIDYWASTKAELDITLNNELKVQKDLFGIDKKWWNQTI